MLRAGASHLTHVASVNASQTTSDVVHGAVNMVRVFTTKYNRNTLLNNKYGAKTQVGGRWARPVTCHLDVQSISRQGLPTCGL